MGGWSWRSQHLPKEGTLASLAAWFSNGSDLWRIKLCAVLYCVCVFAIVDLEIDFYCEEGFESTFIYMPLMFVSCLIA